MAGDGGWGSGDGGWKPKKKAKGARESAPRDAEKEMFRALGRALVVRQKHRGDDVLVRQADDQIQAALRGLRPGVVRRAAREAELPDDAVEALVRSSRSMQPAPAGSGLTPAGQGIVNAAGSAFTETLKAADAPGAAVRGAVAEWSHQGERNPIQVGPLSLRFAVDDPGRILEAAKDGFMHRRVDTPSSIAVDAGKARAEQGVGTESFGVVPGTDLLKGEALPGGTAGKITYDVGGSMVVDPLTYLSFGIGAAAKQGLMASTRVLGAERAAQIAESGVGILSAEEKARLGADVVRRLRGIKGGIQLRVPQPFRAVRRGENLLAPPRTVVPLTPLTKGASRVAHAAGDTRVGGFLERAFVPRGGIKQGKRAGRFSMGTADELDRMRAEFAAASDASMDMRKMAYFKKAHDLSDAEELELLRALETSPAGLSPKVRAAYDDVNEYRIGLADEKRAAGVISSPDEVRAKREAGVARKYAPVHERAAGVVGRIRKRIATQQARLDAARERLAQAQAEAEFTGVPAVRRPGDLPDHFVRDDVAATRRVGEARAAVSRETAKMRVLLNLEKSATGRAATVATREQRAIANLPVDLLDEQYVPHIPAMGSERAAQEAERAAIMGSGGGPSVLTGPPGFARSREIRDTIEGANAAGQRFETDPFLAFAVHSQEARRAIATRRFVDQVLELKDAKNVPLMRPVETMADVSDEALRNAGLARVEIPKVGDFVVDKALKPEITKVARLAGGDDVNLLLRGIDRWMTLWKGYATVPLPFGFGFHMRNGISNVMLNWLADINPIDPAYMQAWRIQRGVSKGMKEGDALKYLAGVERDIAEAALDRNVIGGAFFIEDVPPDLLRPFKSRSARVGEAVNPLDPGNLLIRGGRRVGLEIEENARLAHFIAKSREYRNFDDAAASARKYLFDYGDLTPIEQDVMKRIMPFYTFTRKNTPLWVAAAFKQPGKYSRLAQWQMAFIQAAGGMPAGPIPAYLEQSGAVPVPGVEWGGDPVLLAPDLPPTAASDVVTPAMQLAALIPGADKVGLKANPEGVEAALRPLFSMTGGGPVGAAKAMYDVVQGKDSFTGRPFYPGERVVAPWYVNPLAPLGIDNPLVPKREVDGQMVPALDRRALYLLESLAPMLPKVRSLTPTDPQDKDKQLRRALSILTGIQAYPLGDATKRSEMFRRIEILRRYLSGLAARGVEVPDAPPTRRQSSDGW